MEYNIEQIDAVTASMTPADLLRYAAELTDNEAPPAYAVAVCNRALAKLKGTP